MMKKLVLAGFVVAALSGASSAQAMTLGNWFNEKPAQNAPLVRVQASDSALQIQQLEQTVRTLTGRIEDLNYQLLQMQEQMRKAQDDNEFRFQQLEKKVGGKKSSKLETPTDKKSQEAADAAASAQQAASGKGESVQANAAVSNVTGQVNGDTSIENQAAGQPAGNDAGSKEIAHLQPGTLGSLIFNGDGQLVDTKRNPTDNSAQSLPGVSPGVALPDKQTEEASITPKAEDNVLSSNESYDKAYRYILSGDYAEAEKGFKSYLDQYPKGQKATDASFWLGEAQYSQGRYDDAAKTFLNAYKAHEDAPKAPEILLKLGMSLAAIDSKDTACATFREIPKRYPKASNAVMSKVASERARLACAS
jgi:tol-pal system protein YbgF